MDGVGALGLFLLGGVALFMVLAPRQSAILQRARKQRAGYEPTARLIRITRTCGLVLLVIVLGVAAALIWWG